LEQSGGAGWAGRLRPARAALAGAAVAALALLWGDGGALAAGQPSADTDGRAARPRVSIEERRQALEPPFGPGTLTLHVVLTRAPDPAAPVSVHFQTEDDLAVAPADYLPAVGTLTFTAAGPLVQPITVTVRDDGADAALLETFRVRLTQAVNGRLDRDVGIGEIVDCDPTTPQNTCVRRPAPTPQPTPQTSPPPTSRP
jgi:hypothetical protein